MRFAGELQIYSEPKNGERWYVEAVGQECFAGFIFAIIHLLQTNIVTAVSANMLWQTALIAFTWVATVYWSYNVAGGSNNPAYGLTQPFVDLIDDGEDDAMRYTWIYVVCPIVGAFVAWVIYEAIYKKAHEAPIVGEPAVNKF